MRMVLDSNVLVRALCHPLGAAAELVRQIGVKHQLVVSPFLLVELARVLRYERIRRLHGMDDEATNAAVDAVARMCEVVTPPEGLVEPPIARDPDDNPIIATAIVGRADVLCTLDKHLRRPEVVALCRQHGVRVLTDAELLMELRS
jgi:putative PIN family toxin of toxin-antitoxin system